MSRFPNPRTAQFAGFHEHQSISSLQLRFPAWHLDPFDDVVAPPVGALLGALGEWSLQEMWNSEAKSLRRRGKQNSHIKFRADAKTEA